MSRKIRVAQVVAGLAPRHGGPSYTVPHLCRALGELGDDCTLLTVADRGEPASIEERDGFRVESRCWRGASVPLVGSLRLGAGLGRALAGDFEIIHSHGLWLMPNVQAGLAARRAGRPFILSPRGMLAPDALGYSERRKRLFWRLAQARAVPPSACLHATSEAEYADIRAFGLGQPVAIISNGIDLPDPVPEGGERTDIVFLGRLHPMKNLGALLRAWEAIEPDFPLARLRLVGPDESGHAAELAAQARAAGLRRVSIEPSVGAEAKAALLASAAATILPSRAENFGIAVAESLAAGCPAIATKGTPWSGLARERCGWWVGDDPPSLAAALRDALALPAAERAAMGRRGRDWMARDFAWSGVAGKMRALYLWRLGSGDAPAFVRHD